MPNWCSNDICVVCKDKNDTTQIEELYNLIRELSDNPTRIENGFGNLWFGNIVDKLGGDWEKVYCRGYIDDFQLCENQLWIFATTAWGPMQGFHHFVEEKYPNLKFLYRATEPGCDLHQCNDIDGEVFEPDTWWVDFYSEIEADGWQEDYPTKDDVISAFNKFFAKEFTTTEEIDEWQEEEHGDEYFWYGEYAMIED